MILKMFTHMSHVSSNFCHFVFGKEMFVEYYYYLGFKTFNSVLLDDIFIQVVL